MKSGGDQPFLAAHKTRSVRQQAGTVCCNFRGIAIEPKWHTPYVSVILRVLPRAKSKRPLHNVAEGRIIFRVDDVDADYWLVQAHSMGVEDAILIA
jgi:hypothetical protein